jgi:hypothetical protein
MPIRRSVKKPQELSLAKYLVQETEIAKLKAEKKELASSNHRLDVELAEARYTIIDLMDVRGLLDGYAGLEDHKDLVVWREKALDRLLNAADARPGGQMGDPTHGERALCPLCRAGVSGTTGMRGFAYPEGLRRHLLGESTPRQCEVFSAAEKTIIRRIRAKHVRMHGW